MIESILVQQTTALYKGSVRLSNTSEPEPDVAILQRRPRVYVNHHPTPNDIFALVEVSDTTLSYDRMIKAKLYACEEIQELWIVNLDELSIERYRIPSPDGYRDAQTFRQGNEIAFLAFLDITFALADLLVDFWADPLDPI